MGRLEGLGMGLPLPPLWLCSKPLPILLISSSVQILTVMLSKLWGEKVVTPVRYVAKWGQHRTCWGPVHSRWNCKSVLALCKTSPFKCPTVQCSMTCVTLASGTRHGLAGNDAYCIVTCICPTRAASPSYPGYFSPLPCGLGMRLVYLDSEG